MNTQASVIINAEIVRDPIIPDLYRSKRLPGFTFCWAGGGAGGGGGGGV